MIEMGGMTPDQAYLAEKALEYLFGLIVVAGLGFGFYEIAKYNNEQARKKEEHDKFEREQKERQSRVASNPQPRYPAPIESSTHYSRRTGARDILGRSGLRQ